MLRFVFVKQSDAMFHNDCDRRALQGLELLLRAFATHVASNLGDESVSSTCVETLVFLEELR